MPTYEFRCREGHDFDRFYKTISAAPAELECPECGQPATRQLSGGAGLLFKGSGFYLTDYGKNAHRKPASGKKGESGADTAKSDAPKADTAPKPDTKPGAERRESSAASREPRAESQPKAESREPRTGSKPKSE